MIIRKGQIWIYNNIGPSNNKFYSIIAIVDKNWPHFNTHLECNYGPNDGAWVKSKQYNIDKLTGIVNARLDHGYVLTDDYAINIEKYQEAKIKMEKLNEIMPYGPDQKIMWYNLLKYGKLSASDMIIANQYWARRKVRIGT